MFSFQSSLEAFKKYICIYKERKVHKIAENHQRVSSFFFKTNLCEKSMRKFIKNEWENDDP